MAVDLAPLEEGLEKLRAEDGNLIEALHLAQDIYGYLPRPAMERIAAAYNLPLGRVYGVATFYSLFQLNPPGHTTIQVCLGTACHVRGAEKILREFEDRLGIRSGETTPDGRYSLERISCPGSCGLAPVVVVGEEVHGLVELKDVPKLLPKSSPDEPGSGEANP